MLCRPLLYVGAALLAVLGVVARHEKLAKRAELSPTPTRINCTTNAECMRMGAPLIKPRFRPSRRDTCAPPSPSTDPKYPPTFYTQEGCPEQPWTVPETAYYYITAIGARGVDRDAREGGRGALVGYEFLLNKGDTYSVVAGSWGHAFNQDSAGAGGGLSAVYMGNQLLIIAGGGGGAGKGGKAYGAGYDAPRNLINGSPGTVGGGANGGSRGNAGYGGGASSAGSKGGGGGAGWLGPGSDTTVVRSGGRSRPTWHGGVFLFPGDPREYEFGGFGGGGGPGTMGVSLSTNHA